MLTGSSVNVCYNVLAMLRDSVITKFICEPICQTANSAKRRLGIQLARYAARDKVIAYSRIFEVSRVTTMRYISVKKSRDYRSNWILQRKVSTTRSS